MAAGTSPFAVLFDPHRRDSSIWHARPRCLHAFGLLAPPAECAPTRAYEATDTSHTTDERHSTTQRPPALAHGTVQAVLTDALMLWLEGAGLTRESFRRVDWRWWPTHVLGTWEAAGVRVELCAALNTGDEAVIEARITNTGQAPLAADLVLRGDDNYLTISKNNSPHHLKGAWSWRPDAATMVVSKDPQLAEEMEYFPYSGALPADDPKFTFTASHYQFAFAFGPGAWQQESSAGTNGFKTWQVRRPVRIEAGAVLTLNIGFAGYWSGLQEVPGSMAAKLVQQAEATRQQAFGDVVAASRKMWSELLAKAPVLKRDWPADFVAIYYKAWVTVWADLFPPVDLGTSVSTRPIVTCVRIGDTPFSNPASWEGALGALVLSLVDPQLGCECLEAVYDTSAEDGYISETLGRCGTALACVEPWIAWACFKQSGDKAFLERIWTRVKKNIAYRLHFPWFKHGTVFNVRNYAYGNISARAAMKMARVLERPAEEIAQVQEMIDETERIVHAFWDEEGGYHRPTFDPNERAAGRDKAFIPGTEAATLVALLGVARPEERKRMVEFCRREYVLPGGALARYPQHAQAATGGHKYHIQHFSGFTVKESEHLAIFKGLKDLDRALFEKVARGTVANIIIDGDFWECMSQEGRGRHNGPGSIFGAFSVIWGLLLAEDKVDHLYE